MRTFSIEPVGLLALLAELVGKRVAHAPRQHVPQVAQRDDLADLHVTAAPPQQVLEQLQTGALALQRPGERDQDVQQGRGERVHVAEVRPVRAGRALRVQQRVLHPGIGLLEVGERRFQGEPGIGRTGLEDTLLDDRGKVAVLQVDHVETLGQVTDLGLQVLHLDPGHVLADQLGQVPLPRHERDDRHRAVRHP